MDPDFITQAFEFFFTTKEIGEGNGLGLSMVYSFIKQSNDHVVTINKLDRGTQIDLFLPKSEESDILRSVVGKTVSSGRSVFTCLHPT